MLRRRRRRFRAAHQLKSDYVIFIRRPRRGFGFGLKVSFNVGLPSARVLWRRLLRRARMLSMMRFYRTEDSTVTVGIQVGCDDGTMRSSRVLQLHAAGRCHHR